MRARWLTPDGADLGVRRGDVVVWVSADGGPDTEEQVRRCLLALSAHTLPHVPIIVCASPPLLERCEDVVRGLDGDREVTLAPSASMAAGLSASADLALVRSSCVVADGWLAGLREAAYSDSRVAAAGALSTLDVPQPDAVSFDEAAALVRRRALRIRPRVAAPGPSCRYVRRSALELIGELDEAFWQRCVQRGLCHVLADDVLVLDDAAAAAVPNEGPAAAPLSRSLASARRALRGLSILIDARVLSGPMNGTQRHVLELIAALSQRRDVRVGALIAAEVGDEARTVLETLRGVELRSLGDGAPADVDVVHRPFQISTPADLTILAGLADRLVVTHQDLISYHNPAYFRSVDAWEGYRDITRTALAVADHVVFFSAHARDDALAEDLVEPHRASVVHLGVDHAARGTAQPAVPPPAVETLPDEAEIMLCLGTDFEHKNRLFALAILSELRSRHSWAGRLVLAGPRAVVGSSAEEETRVLERQSALADAVIRLGPLSEAEKEWLLRRATLVLYPSVHEGFGLVPFEAASHGVPCLWARGTSLSEILPDEAAGIVPWDPVASADAALALMREEPAREANLAAIRSAARALRWEQTAAQLLEVYLNACERPPSPAGLRERTGGLMQRGLSEDAMRLVGPDGLLPRELERPLLALASHRRLGAPVFRAIKAGYEASARRRRRRR